MRDTVSDRRIGKYRVVRTLGEGGMGTVYEVFNEEISRRAAAKLLHADLAQDPDIAARFINEARAANIVQHSGIVNVFEFGQTADGDPFIVLEYLEGETLWARMQRVGRIGPDTLRLGRQLASALVAAHAKNVVHRDLKPENVMLVHDPEVPGGERTKILDFGLAKLAAELRGPGATHLRTRSGVMMGTPIYMSPEQCRGAGAVDDKTDVYALGVMLYEMLAGQPPFMADGAGELIGMHLHIQPPPLPALDAGVPEDIIGLVRRMLLKDPRQRPAMAEVEAELERLGAPRATGAAVAVSPGRLAAGGTTGPGASPSSSLGQASGERYGWRRRSTKTAALAGAGAMAILLVGMGVLLPQHRKGPVQAAPVSGPARPPSPPVQPQPSSETQATKPQPPILPSPSVAAPVPRIVKKGKQSRPLPKGGPSASRSQVPGPKQQTQPKTDPKPGSEPDYDAKGVE